MSRPLRALPVILLLAMAPALTPGSVAAAPSKVRLTGAQPSVGMTSVVRDGRPVRVANLAIAQVEVSCRLSTGATASFPFAARLGIAPAVGRRSLSFHGTDRSRTHASGGDWHNSSRVAVTLRGKVSRDGARAAGWLKVRTRGVEVSRGSRFVSLCSSKWLRWRATPAA